MCSNLHKNFSSYKTILINAHLVLWRTLADALFLLVAVVNDGSESGPEVVMEDNFIQLF